MPELLKYLFNSKGDWIASQVENNVFSTNKHWLGWVREEDGVVISPRGRYMGTVMCVDRLFYCEDHPGLDKPTSTVRMPPYSDHPGYPGKAEPQGPPPGARDLNERDLSRGIPTLNIG